MWEKLRDWLFGNDDASFRQAQLPSRVGREIRSRETSSEILIGWAQLAIVVFFAVLYFAAPRAQGSQGFNFVPYALAAYFLFTLVRLVVSYRTNLPGWYLVLSIITDVALLFGIIFSFHIQYGQHPTFYLKAPTVMYIFLFITLRALRFDPRYVLLSGAIAVIGWAGLVGYAVISDPTHVYVTRNYVEYLTMNSILIGAELDKIMIILAVTIILSLAIVRGRLLLVAAVREHAAVEELSRFFAPEVARTIADADEDLQAGDGQVRQIAVLVVDVRDFTATSSRLAPGAVMAMLKRYQTCVVPIIQHHGGRVDKFLGDGILATFGAVKSSQTYAADAIRAANEIIATLKENQSDFTAEGWLGEFRVGCAVTCGQVTVGLVGAEDRLEFTVIGDPVNLATKLENHNKVLNSRALTVQSCLDVAEQQGYTISTPVRTHAGQTVLGIEDPKDVAVLSD